MEAWGKGLAVAAVGSSVLACSVLGWGSPDLLPQDPFIQVYFNHNEQQHYNEPYRPIKKRPGDDLEAVIVQEINQAQRSIHIAVQEFRLPLIAQALAAKKQEGVTVQVILENDYHYPITENQGGGDSYSRAKVQELRDLVDRNQDGQLSAEELAQRDALGILERAGIPIIDDRADGSAGSDLMHHKFMVIDGQKVVTGSVNWTTSSVHGDFSDDETRGNANNLLVMDSAMVAQAFLEEFQLMWGDGPGGRENSKFGLKKPERSPVTFPLGNGQVTVQFSPVNRRNWEGSGNALITKTVSQSRTQADMALFVFSDQAIADGLLTARNQGSRIRLLVDANFIFQYYSEALDLLGQAIARNCVEERNNRPWNPAIDTVGTANLPQGDKLHHKFAVIDQRTVITGSHNWSASANHNNDETLLVIDNPTVAAHFQREFDRLYQDANLGIPPQLQDRIGEEKQKCNL